jgi:putative membrane-bound dehydrogenase-like protein
MKLRVIVIALCLAGALRVSAAPVQLTGPHAPATTPALPPAEAQKKFVVPEGFEVRLFAAEPDVINPVAMTWDERGRLWVVELFEYPHGAKPGTKPRDRIKILEDTDNDGRADKVTVFADGLNLATGILLGNGGVYVGEAPNLLFLRDTNHDDKADTREVLLTGFGLDDRHELLNGFTWGPDGWLYMTHGVFTQSKVKIPEATEPGVEMTAAVARFHPRTKKFEVFAEGTSNPWGVDFDAAGNAFVSACVIDHLFHMAPGGIYQRQSGVPANPYAYELLPSIVDHKHYMAAYCGICIYQGNNFPDEYQGRVFMGNIHQNAINQDRLIPTGSSFKAVAEKDFLTTSDGWFMPVSEQVGPDGALWIADWYDKYPCYQNALADPEGVDRERGRIWRVVYVGKEPRKEVAPRPDVKLDLSRMKSDALVKLLEHPNVWQRRTAQRILSERNYRDIIAGAKRGSETGSVVHAALKDMINRGETLDARLAAVWTLHGVRPAWTGYETGTFVSARDVFEQQLVSAEPAIRAWSIRFIAEAIPGIVRIMSQNRPWETGLPANFLSHLQKLASDPDPRVRLAAATACRELISSSLTVDRDVNCDVPVGKVLSALIKSSADGQDPLLPFMIWMAWEPLVAHNPASALRWLAENGPATKPLSEKLTYKVMRRICDTGATTNINHAVAFLTAVTGKDEGLTVAALNGLMDGQKARPVRPGVETTSLFARLNASRDPSLKERALRLGALWGDPVAIRRVLARVNDNSLPVEQRTEAIGLARVIRSDAARDAVQKVITPGQPQPLMREAIRALGDIGGDAVAGALLASWNGLSRAERDTAADVLASRGQWALALLSAVQTNFIRATELPVSALRALAESGDAAVRQRAAEVIGRVRPSAGDKQQLIAQKRRMILAGGPPDLSAGHEVARKVCLVCHRLNGEGADVGPDLTGVGRSSLDSLLANIIDPNLVVGKGYENVILETKDDRTVTGRLVESTPTQVKLLSSGPKEEIVARKDIASMRVSKLSVMPEGLEQMPDDDFRNLIGYILSTPAAR